MLRYAAFQLPEFGIFGLLVWMAHHYWSVPGWAALLALGAWVLKDVALFPFLRRAYEPREHAAGGELLGAVGRAEDDLAPRGYVRLGHELWQAECEPGATPIRVGDAVRVRAVEGLTLRVERAEPEAAADNR